MKEKYGSYYRMIGVLADLVLLNLSGYLAHILIFWPRLNYTSGIGVLQILLINFIWFNVSQITGLYRDVFAKDAIPTIHQSLSCLLLFAMLLSLLGFFVPDFYVSRKLIFFMVICFSPLLLIGKICFLLMRRAHRYRLMDFTRVVIVGAGPVGMELNNIIQGHRSMGYKVEGFFDDQSALRKNGITILGNINDCMAYVKRYHIKEIFCALPDRAIDTINELMREADKEMIRFKLVPDVKDYFRKDVNVRMLGHFPVISARVEPLENVNNKFFKRIFDVLFSLSVILFLLSWTLPFIALIIKFESRGPVFFKQLRSGKNNKPFYCLKFRSMQLNADSDQKQASRNDQRMTRFGAFIRKTSIDELPQFFNVLLGEMSVVGPRPHMLQHTEQYSAIIDQFMVRHFLLPGITGWAQVNGHRGETNEEGTMEERIKADIWYMENWSVFLDLKIVFLTVWHVIGGNENAY
ncbi:undecaprenyl-phosphate glucose phosphotransferase [Pedobacter metabolipauper]|uniref:Undecaprenyl-phosphate galactose phosphotransferase/putative colanic acid biosynthesis UDP-glucose lipid carrier transferase n=1 Tax=Pedobacter metabolipauper TaxID=425513 RepID=A0A4R6SXR7_9SPHI|nr:undecaprenyl-phosphate glucose phosphotransferase [Pedobacter metabolipauper]TDQ10003.1 undecaprenyl-phosphate galactose phosphotransferase/putative colanic acid biosynthesis UDP-glucose lipid carrier transferase [Pedobacter metabolipauper]